MTRNTRPEEIRAEQEWHERADCARRASCDFLREIDDLAAPKGIVWAVLAVLCTLAVLAMLLAPAAARAQELWLTANTVSWHNQQDCATCPSGKVNQANWGGGLEARFDHGLVAMAGGYRNSWSRTTTYLLGAWQPIEAGWAKAGIFAGAVTGYRNEEDCKTTVCPAAGLMFSVQRERVGINLMVVPAVSPKHTTVIGLQVKARLV
jgi:hypothetical protein